MQRVTIKLFEEGEDLIRVSEDSVFKVELGVIGAQGMLKELLVSHFFEVLKRMIVRLLLLYHQS